ncbi:SDR family oxidoreductase [Yaniella flava]|uniref:SDR family oxidoreductase n=1 Tax=Yaniella flava TaxID=287930 RepID=A0ABN2UE94_9MICC
MSISNRRIAVITGASGGIGRATAIKLCDEGYDIIAHYHSDLLRSQELQEQIEQKGRLCWLVTADLATEEGINSLLCGVADVLDVLPNSSLTALVNNAALLLGPSFEEATVSEFDRYFAVNSRAPLFISQGIAKLMAPGGSIVNISSAAAHFSSPGDIVYAMTKATIESFTKNAAQALAGKGIRINAVMPGFTDNGHQAFKSPTIRTHMSNYSVLGGVSSPETVAEAISFLLSDQADRTTGAVLDVSGGSALGARQREKNSFSLRDLRDEPDQG